MTVRRVLSLAALLAVTTVSAWGQIVLNITPTSLPAGGGVFVVGQTIPSQHLTTQFPNDPTNWSVSSGSMPPGLNPPNDVGIITGTPTVAGAFTFTVSATDVSNNFTGSQQYTVFVSTGAPLTLTPLNHVSGAAGSFYFGLLFQVSGGVPGYTWSLPSGTNADGLTIDPSIGFLTGIPLGGGVFPIGATVVDASGASITSSNNNLSVLGITTASLPNGGLGILYSQSLAAAGASGTLSWSVPPGTLPPGLNLSALGQITGTPTAGGTFPFQVTVTDSVSGLSTSASFSITIPLGLTITTGSLPGGTIGTAYSPSAFAAVGGSGPLTWSVPPGSLPPGLSLTGSQISGTPTQAGAFTFLVTVVDPATKLTTNQSFTITITPTLTLNTNSLPNGVIGFNYSQTLQATGGTLPYTWSATGVPTGLALDSNTGILSGTPTATGTSTISVTLVDAAQAAVTKQLGLTVGTLAITPTSLSNGFQNIPYPPVSLAVTGNPTITNWAVTTGALPAGLILNGATGVISGTPTTVGSSTFTISASLAIVIAVVPPVQQQFTLVISAPPSVTISGLPATGGAATQPSASVSLSGGTYPLNLTGTMTLTFAPASGGAQTYDEMFSSSGTTANFTIPTGKTQGLFGTASSVSVLTGTVAGTITVSTRILDSLGNPLPAPAPTAITINSTPPVITKVTLGTVTASGFSISVTGYSTPRNMTSALFHFTSPTNTQLAAADVTVLLTSAFTSWYGSAASNPFGSQFTMTVQFSFTGPPGTTVPFTAVTVTLTNSVGTSAVFGPLNP